MNVKRLLQCCLALLIWMQAAAQNFSVSGKIISTTDNASLSGVNVRVKGAYIGTQTTADGSFSITVPSPTSILLISSVGYTPQEIAVNSRNEINVSLVASAGNLGEVVVIGYGTQSRREVTSATSTVKAKDIANIPVTTPAALLQGRAAGVTVVQNNGAPGTNNLTVRVRGTTSINAGNSPLYIIDGIPVEGALSFNVNDIESMDVLKDASALAIYGSRAANGVVLITTKRGKVGTTVIEFNAYAGVQKAALSTFPKLMNTAEWLDLIQEQRANAGTDPYAFVLPDNGLIANTNWINEIVQDGPISNYEIALRGGENKINYALSGGYFNQKGILLGSYYKRYTVRANLDFRSSEKLKFGTSLSFTKGKSNNLGTEFNTDLSVTRLALFKAPVFPVYNADGSYNKDDISNVQNPVAVAKEVKNEFNNNRFLGNVFGEYTIIPNLKFRTSFGFDYSGTVNDFFRPSFVLRNNNVARGSFANNNDNNWINENLLTYNFTLKGNHKFSALAGYSQQENRGEDYSATAEGYGSDNISTLNASSLPIASSSSATSSGLSSVFGRVTYSFNGKYIVEASIRRDGSSRFGAGNKFATFPGASIGWRVIDESFMKNISFINDLKLRVSAGKTGNQAGISDFGAQGVYGTGQGYLGQPGVGLNSIPNPNLKWETTTQYNVGLDISLLSNRITLNVDAYLKKTNDLLLSIALPPTSGFSSSLQNVGATQNKGLEFNLNTVNINSRDFRWTSNFNISFNKNKVVSLNSGVDQLVFSNGTTFSGGSNPLAVIRVGQPIGNFYGWQSQGVYAFSTDNKNAVRDLNATGYLFKGGDMIFVDQNGDNIITDADRVIIGNALPDFTGGFNNTFQYKDFDLNVLSQFSYGNDIFNSNRTITESMFAFGNGTKNLLRRWKKEGDVTDIPVANTNDPGNNRRSSTRWVEDGSYLRIKTATLGYKLPTSLTNRAKLKNVRVYISAQNLATFTKYSGIDPETSAFNARVADLGIDYATYPQSRTFIAGITIGLQ